MIATIDSLRKQFNGAISAALSAQYALAQIDRRFEGLQSAPRVEAIDEMNEHADAAIHAWAKAIQAASDPAATIHVGGDFYRVGDITDSSNIAIGRDIKQGK